MACECFLQHLETAPVVLQSLGPRPLYPACASCTLVSTRASLLMTVPPGFALFASVHSTGLIMSRLLATSRWAFPPKS